MRQNQQQAFVSGGPLCSRVFYFLTSKPSATIRRRQFPKTIPTRSCLPVAVFEHVCQHEVPCFFLSLSISPSLSFSFPLPTIVSSRRYHLPYFQGKRNVLQHFFFPFPCPHSSQPVFSVQVTAPEREMKEKQTSKSAVRALLFSVYYASLYKGYNPVTSSIYVLDECLGNQITCLFSPA